MSMIYLGSENGPVIVGGNRVYDVDLVSDLNPEDFAKQIAARVAGTTAVENQTIHLRDRFGGQAPEAPWQIPKAS